MMMAQMLSNGDDVELGVAHLDPHGDGERSPVDAVEPVGLLAFQEMDGVARASDTGYDNVAGHGPLGLDVQVFHRELEGSADAEITASRAP
jgi:hypothetical protein